MWRPWLDVVRVDGVDDPSGGVFDGAPDYWMRDVPDSVPPEFEQQPSQIDLRK
jgi:hypothetical protein